MRCRARYWANEGRSNRRLEEIFGEELHDFCPLQNTRMTTSKTTRYAKPEIFTDDWKK